MGNNKLLAAVRSFHVRKKTLVLGILFVMVFCVLFTAIYIRNVRRDASNTDIYSRYGMVHDGSPSWSPDGAHVVFYSEEGGNADIFVMDADGSNRKRLTQGPADDGYPAWSPDGTRISFDSDRDGNYEIYVMNADGSQIVRLTKNPARDVSAAWSSDGSKIAFMSDRSGGFDIYIMNSNGSDVNRITQLGSCWFPQWSPDGTRLSFHVGRDVYVMKKDGTGLERLTFDPQNGMYPSWSPDGRRIVFMSWRDGSTALYTMNSDGSAQARVLWSSRGDYIDPRWSPDGSQFVFVFLPNGMNPGPSILMGASAVDFKERILSKK